MSDQPSIFEASTSEEEEVVQPATSTVETTTSTPAAPTVQLPDEVSELIGEGKKYKTIEDALRALPHAQNHIATIEADNAKLRKDLEQANNLDEAVNSLTDEVRQTARPATPATPTENINDVVRNVFAQMSQEQQEAANRNAADLYMLEEFGDKRFEVMANVSKNLGVSADFLKSTAEKSPAAFKKLVSDNQHDASVERLTSDRSTVNDSARQHFQSPEAPTVKVKLNPSSKDLLAGWKAAGEKVKQQ
jgi:hypothetical protein